MIEILPAHQGHLLQAAAALFRDYAQEVAPLCGQSLAHQNIDVELAALPGKYAPPTGGIWLARTASSAQDAQSRSFVGCVAIRPLQIPGQTSGHTCELKRMYVAPAARGRGVGVALCRAAINFSASAGYSVIKLDTSASMHPAIALYRAAGFVPCERYNDDPMADTLWFELQLGDTLH